MPSKYIVRDRRGRTWEFSAVELDKLQAFLWGKLSSTYSVYVLAEDVQREIMSDVTFSPKEVKPPITWDSMGASSEVNGLHAETVTRKGQPVWVIARGSKPLKTSEATYPSEAAARDAAEAELHRLGRENGLPQLRKGEYINITSGEPSEQFIRRQRDGEE